MDRIDVGIITMKEEEYLAVLKKFLPVRPHAGKNRDYEISEVTTPKGICRVAITRTIHQGNAYAQAAAAEMHGDLAPAYLLIVGIAGAVPTTDFCLGDVVVSSHIYDLTLEDTGTGTDSRKFDPLGGPLDVKAGRIVESLPAILLRAEAWATPGSIGHDRPPYDGEFTTEDAAWNRQITLAVGRRPSSTVPIAVAKKIASSDRLVKDPELIQHWQKVIKGIAAVEMESAGAHLYCQRNGIPVLAIRGISDVIGWKRDEAWTLYACHTAARLAQVLVEQGVFLVEGGR